MKKEIRSLTGLRGVAAVAVALYHYGDPAVAFGVVSHMHVPKGYLAVDIFFMLSGFVLAYNYADLFVRKVDLTSAAYFFGKRLFRVYPAYAGMLTLYLLKMLVNVSGDNPFRLFSWPALVANGLMLTGWGLDFKAIIGPSWSVSAELACYVFFPALTFVILGTGPAGWVAGAIAGAAGLAVVGMSGLGAMGVMDVVDGGSLYPLLRAGSGFILGMLILPLRSTLGHVRHVWADLAASLSCLCFLLGAATGLSDYVMLAVVFVMVTALSLDGPVTTAIFGNPLTMFLGRISYSLYLAHQLLTVVGFRTSLALTHNIGETAAYWSGVALYLAACVTIATISFELVEKRGRALGYRMFVAAPRRLAFRRFT